MCLFVFWLVVLSGGTDVLSSTDSMTQGYMEFGQVVAAFRRRLGEIFDARPASLRALEELANEPVAAVLLMPTVPTKSGK